MYIDNKDYSRLAKDDEKHIRNCIGMRIKNNHNDIKAVNTPLTALHYISLLVHNNPAEELYVEVKNPVKNHNLRCNKFSASLMYRGIAENILEEVQDVIKDHVVTCERILEYDNNLNPLARIITCIPDERLEYFYLAEDIPRDEKLWCIRNNVSVDVLI